MPVLTHHTFGLDPEVTEGIVALGPTGSGRCNRMCSVQYQVVEHVCENVEMRLTEQSPDCCPNGHRLTANTCLVGWEVCGCASTENGGHRTHYCRRCGETVRTPECVGVNPQKSRWS